LYTNGYKGQSLDDDEKWKATQLEKNSYEKGLQRYLNDTN